MAAGIFYVDKSVWAGRQLALSKIFSIIGQQDAPFYNYLHKTHFQGDGLGTVADGFSWTYKVAPDASQIENANVEGGRYPSEEHYISKKLTNFNQIFMASWGVSGTAAARSNPNEDLNAQKHMSLIAMQKDINKALITNATGVGGTSQTRGKLIGLAGLFGAHNEIDAGNAVLSVDLLEALGMLFSDEGVNMTTLMMNKKQKQKLNRLYEEGIRTQEGRTKLSLTNIQKVENVFGFNGTLDVLVDSNVPDNEIIVFDRNSLLFNSFREEDNKDITPNDADKISRGALVEGTLVYRNPMVLGRIKNLASK